MQQIFSSHSPLMLLVALETNPMDSFTTTGRRDSLAMNDEGRALARLKADDAEAKIFNSS
jgi:hypothetical protein